VLNATNNDVTEGQIKLFWEASGDDGTSGTASSYLIKISSDQIYPEDFEAVPDTLPNPPQPQPSGSDEEYLVTGLTPDDLYYFMLKVTDDAGNSALSSSANDRAQIDVTPPMAIDLEATGNSDELIEGQILLTWEAPGDDADSGGVVTSYDFRYALNPIEDDNDFYNATVLDAQINWGPRMNGPGEQDSLIAGGFTEGQTYHFACKAEDDIGLESELSNSPSTTPQIDVTDPAKITTLEASGNDADLVEGQIRLQWTAVGDDGHIGDPVSDYDFRFSDSPIDDSNFKSAPTLDGYIEDGPHYSAPGVRDSLLAGDLEPGGLRYFACKAIDDHGRFSPVSNCAWDTVQTDVTPPAKVTTLDASTGSWQGALDVRWIAVADDSADAESGPATEYDLRYSTTGPIDSTNWHFATRWPDMPSPPEPGLPDSVTLTNLDFDTVYYVALKAKDDADLWSDISNCDWAPSGADVTPPQNVNWFVVDAGDEILELTWEPPDDPDYEGVLIGRLEGAPVNTEPVRNRVYSIGDFLPDEASTVVYIGGGNGWDDEDVKNGATYHYRAFSYDAYWNYSYGHSASGTPADVTAPGPITDFIADQIPEGIRLSWTCPSDDDFESVKIVYGLADYPSSHNDGTELTIEPGEPGEPDTTLHASPVEQTYYYAAFAGDEVPNYSTAKTDSATYDVSPPDSVTHLILTPGVQSITVAWDNPVDPDRDGIIVLRREDSAVQDLPQQGEDYAGETEIGTSDIVVILGPGVPGQTEYEDTGLTSETEYH